MKKFSKGNDGEVRTHSMLSLLQSYIWDAARGGALRSLNDFLPCPIQWKAHNGGVQSLHKTANPESLWKHCNRAPRTHTHRHSQMYVTHGAQWTQSLSIWRSPVCLRRNSDMFPGTQLGSHYWESQRSQNSPLSSAGGLEKGRIPGHSSSIWIYIEKASIKMSSSLLETAACSFSEVSGTELRVQHVNELLLLFVTGVCLVANEGSVFSSSHLSWCKARYSLWLRIPFGFTRHGKALVKREGNERAGRLNCDGGQLLNWATNKQAWKCKQNNTGLKEELKCLHCILKK